MPASEVYYDIARDHLAQQMQNIDGLDTKAATAYAFASGMLGFFGALFSLTAKVTVQPEASIFLGLLVAAGVTYVTLLVCVLLAYQVSARWSYRPNLEDLGNLSATRSSDVMQIWVARECMQSVMENGPRLRAKARFLAAALLLLPLEALLLSTAALIALQAR